MNIVTFEEFRKMVLNYLKDNFLGETLSEKEIGDYLKKEEDVLKRIYDRDMKEYKKGEISDNIFKGDCVASASYCLYMMYE